MRAQLISAVITLTMIGVTTYGFIEWNTGERARRDAVCKAARQHKEEVEIRARAMAAGLSVDAYAEAEKAEVGKLVSSLDTAKNDAEVEAVIDAHAAELQAQDAATDAELKNQGSQQFLEQKFKEQRITTDIKQEIERAEKAVAVRITSGGSAARSFARCCRKQAWMRRCRRPTACARRYRGCNSRGAAGLSR